MDHNLRRQRLAARPPDLGVDAFLVTSVPNARDLTGLAFGEPPAQPGVYLPGVGGVRIEDVVEVGADGCRSLARSTKELLVL